MGPRFDHANDHTRPSMGPRSRSCERVVSITRTATQSRNEQTSTRPPFRYCEKSHGTAKPPDDNEAVARARSEAFPIASIPECVQCRLHGRPLRQQANAISSGWAIRPGDAFGVRPRTRPPRAPNILQANGTLGNLTLAMVTRTSGSRRWRCALVPNAGKECSRHAPLRRRRVRWVQRRRRRRWRDRPRAGRSSRRLGRLRRRPLRRCHDGRPGQHLRRRHRGRRKPRRGRRRWRACRRRWQR